MKTKLTLLLAVTWLGNNVNAQTNSEWGGIWTNLIPLWMQTNRELIHVTNMANVFVLPAKLSTEVVTNWTVTSVEYPTADWANKAPGFNTFTLEYHATGYHETGVVLSNTIATIEWKEKRISVVLESVQIGTEYRTTWK
jgi:hypothetical protein